VCTHRTSVAFNSQYLYRFILLIFLINIFAAKNVTAEEDQGRLYSTREERREAGVKHEITPWLIVSGLAEFEWEWKKFRLRESDGNDYFKNNSAAIQIGIDVIPADWAKIEIITEYDTDANEIFLDEATLAFERDAWELVIGKQALDFGVFFSHFASGPIIEFGETIDYAITLAYNYQDIFDVSVSAFRGDAHKINSNNSQDWNAALESWFTDDLSFGMSFLSDLAEADIELLSDFGNRYQKKVPALSGYMLWVEENFEISLEALGAIRDFSELDTDRNQPIAWNMEFVHFLSPKLDWSLRLEGSYELEDEPELQVGMALNYRLHKNIFLTTEILHGFFRNNLATDDNNNDFDTVTSIGALLSVSF